MALYDFYKETTFHGLCYIRKEKPKFFHVFWFIIFLVGLGATGRDIFTTVQYFLSKPMSTEYKIMSQTSMELPRIMICTSSNRFNGSMIRKLNISDDMVVALNRDYSSYTDPLAPARQNEEEFEKILRRTQQEYKDLKEKLNFTDHAQFVDMLYSKCENIVVQCRSHYGQLLPCCESADLFESAYGSCVLLARYIQSSAITSDIQITLKFPNATELSPARNQHMRDDLTIHLSDGDRFMDISPTQYAVARGSYTAFSMEMVAFESVDNPPEYVCKSVEPNERYNRLDCNMECFIKKFVKPKLPCRLPVSNVGRKIGSYDPKHPTCDPWMLQNRSSFAVENLNFAPDSATQILDDCDEKCPETCRQIRYKFSIRSLSKLSHTMLAMVWKDEKKAEHMAENHAILAVGFEKVEETRIRQQFSFTSEMLVGQLGGFLGLFLGGSLISLVHVIVCILQTAIYKPKDK